MVLLLLLLSEYRTKSLGDQAAFLYICSSSAKSFRRVRTVR
jgi:hypothetical protein